MSMQIVRPCSNSRLTNISTPLYAKATSSPLPGSAASVRAEALQKPVRQPSSRMSEVTQRRSRCNLLTEKSRVLGLLNSQTRHDFLSGSLLFFAFLAWSGMTPDAIAATHTEPSNALSIPTWVIHVSSVIEWSTAMVLMWRYAEVTGNQRWKGMTWGMMPLFTGSLCACTYHFFYNSPQMDFLVPLQAAFTWIGNATLWAAAYRIFKDSQAAAES